MPQHPLLTPICQHSTATSSLYTSVNQIHPFPRPVDHFQHAFKPDNAAMQLQKIRQRSAPKCSRRRPQYPSLLAGRGKVSAFVASRLHSRSPWTNNSIDLLPSWMGDLNASNVIMAHHTSQISVLLLLLLHLSFRQPGKSAPLLNLASRLQPLPHWRIHSVISVAHLEPAPNPSNDRFQRPRPAHPPAVSMKGDVGIYIVPKLVGRRQSRRGSGWCVEYLVR